MENKTQNTVNFIINLFLKVLLAVVAVALLLYSAGGGIFAGSLFSFKRQKPAITIENTGSAKIHVDPDKRDYIDYEGYVVIKK